MDFISLASSSRGNAYLVKADGAGPLLIEAGLPISSIREKLREYGVSLSDLDGCLISHEHGDHARSVKDLMKSGIDCFMSWGTADALGVTLHHRFQVLSPSRPRQISTHWTVTSFPLEHDTQEPTGFVIDQGGQRLLFVPDTALVRDTFERITISAVECNNIEEILINNVLDGHLPAVVGKRIRGSHMSLETLIRMLKSNDLSRCREIWLLHLSDGNSDEARMVKEVQAATGIPTKAC